MALALVEFPSPEVSASSESSDSERDASPTPDHKPLEPVGKRGQWSAVYGGKFYVYGGYAGRVFTSRRPLTDHLDVFDFSKGEWSVMKTEGESPRVVSGACSAVNGDCLYMFGGWYRGIRNADVYELSLVDLRWKKLTECDMKDSPLCKDKAGMVDYGSDMLCVTGGYGQSRRAFHSKKGVSYHLDKTSYFQIGWTNELHLFHIKSCEWIIPELTGIRPPPCAAFSFTRVDQHRAVLFGGRQLEERTDQLHILDMEKWHWSGVILPSGPDYPWPPKRSFHAACPLVDPNCSHFSHTSPDPPSSERKHPWLPCRAPDLSSGRDTAVGGSGTRVDPHLIVLWGMDNNSDPINDAWILNVNSLTWKKVDLQGLAGPGRIWHTAGSYYPVSHAALVVAVGGSDENLFSTDDEAALHNVETTTLLSFGVSDLFELTSRFVAENLHYFLPLLKQLPHHIVEVISREGEVLRNKKYYHTVNCSI